MAKQNKGITMIALVVTIIVILILAGVTMATFSGQNGLWSKVSGAKESNIRAEDMEQIDLAFDAIMVDKLTSDYYYYEDSDDIEVKASELKAQLIADGVEKSVSVSDGLDGVLYVDMPSGRSYSVKQPSGNVEFYK